MTELKTIETHQSPTTHSPVVDDAVGLLLETKDLASLDAQTDSERSQDPESDRLSDEGEGDNVMKEEDDVLF